MNFCRKDGCPGIATQGLFCPAHKNETALAARERHPNEKFYAKAAWKGTYGVRRFKLKRNPVCEFVAEDGTKCIAPTSDIHHVDGSWKETGDWTLFLGGVGTLEDPCPNLMSLCRRHHSEITMQAIKDGTAVSVAKE